jgi:hypothetical protein
MLRFCLGQSLICSSASNDSQLKIQSYHQIRNKSDMSGCKMRITIFGDIFLSVFSGVRCLKRRVLSAEYNRIDTDESSGRAVITREWVNVCFEIDTIKQHADKPHLLSCRTQTTVNSVCCHQASSKTGRIVKGEKYHLYSGVTWSNGVKATATSVQLNQTKTSAL